MNKIKALLFITIFFSVNKSISQENIKDFTVPDSLKSKNYDEFLGEFSKNSEDTIRASIYLKSYLKKALYDQDSIKMARAYTILSYYQDSDQRRLSYLNKAILLSKGQKNKYFPVLSYIYMGVFYKGNWKYDKALQSFLKALEYAKKYDNHIYVHYAKCNIGTIKNKIGKHEEALEIFREAVALEDQKKEKDSITYAEILYSISEVFSNLKKLDSSNYYTEKGLKISRNNEYGIHSKLQLIKAINLFKKEQYDQASQVIHRIKKELYVLADKEEWIRAHFYLGKIKERTQQQDSAQYYYQKIDTFFQSKIYAIHEVRDSYVSLLSMAKTKKNKDEQLLYIKRLLDFDSTVSTTNRKLSEKLITEYDTQQLLSEKQQIIRHTQQKKNLYQRLFTIFIILFLLTSSLVLYQYFKRKKYQKRFEKLIRETYKKREPIEQETSFTSIEEIGMSQTLITELSEKLIKFEKNEGFLAPNITTTVLAKKFKTNNKYLSKVIHTTKGKKVNHYINDLRIDYTVERLKNDTIFRAYTVKAIASEIGFTNAESFSKYFHKKTGLYPSYFIKKLNAS